MDGATAPSAPAASREDILRLRLRAHGLHDDSLVSPEDVAERMLAVQAQDLRAACWAVGVRSGASDLGAITAALDAGAIVRSWPMRGTLHLVPAAELGWMLQLTAPRMLAATRTRRARLGLDDDTVARARDATEAALAGGRELTRAQFMQLLEGEGISTAGQRGYHLIFRLAQDGLICWGPTFGAAQKLVLLDEWVPARRTLERDEALGEFVLRYFRGHGPAKLQDFVWWSQLTVADARVGLRVAGPRLTTVRFEDETLYQAASTDTADVGGARVQHSPVEPSATQRFPVLALPGFDEYLLGYRDRSLVISDSLLPSVVPGRNGIFLPVIVIDGRVVGIWRASATRAATVLEARPFAPLNRQQQAYLADSIRRYSHFLGMPPAIEGDATL